MKDEAKQKIWTDQPGRFPKKLMKGSQYMMVLTESESDAIHVEPMKNRTSGEMIRAYQVLINQLQSAGIAPKQHILDNSFSNDFKEAIKTNNMTYQLVPPQSKRLRTTSWQFSVAPTRRFRSTFGTYYYAKWNTPSTCHDRHA